MDKLKITGNGPLKGEVEISGAKNAALPLIAASLLTSDPLHLTNTPELRDINTMLKLLEYPNAGAPDFISTLEVNVP